MNEHPFRGKSAAGLYRDAKRQRRRVEALLDAKVSGTNVSVAISAIAQETTASRPRLLEVGCGRGGTLSRLVTALEPRRAVALDSSAAMLEAARKRVGPPVETVLGDFHHLPFREGEFDLVVAAFCLYHSDRPEAVCNELARCLSDEGTAVLATKSADSYKELDVLVGASGLDPAAPSKPSLYERCHSENLEKIARTAFTSVEVRHEMHRFVFATPQHAATYVSTVPKYRNCRDIDRVAAVLAKEWPAEGVEATSNVTLGIARK